MIYSVSAPVSKALRRTPPTPVIGTGRRKMIRQALVDAIPHASYQRGSLIGQINRADDATLLFLLPRYFNALQIQQLVYG